MSSDTVRLTQKSLDRGHDFYFWGYVHDVKVCQGDAKFYVESKCWASQRKHMEYTQKIVLSEMQQSEHPAEMESEGEERASTQLRVTYASCIPCPAGTSGGLCQHVFALLILLQHYAPKSRSLPAASLPGSDSVTSGKKLWGPRERDIAPKTVMETMVEKAKDPSERKKSAITCSLYEARGPATRKLSKESIAEHKQGLSDVCRLRPMLPSGTSDIPYVETQYGEAPLGSVLSYQLAGSMDTFREQVLQAKERGDRLIRAAAKKQEFLSQVKQPSSHQWSEETVEKYRRRKEEGYDVPDEDYEAWLRSLPAVVVSPTIQFPILPLACTSVCNASLREHLISTEEAQHIQQSTVGQASNALWLELHGSTITSSNFKKVVSRQSAYTIEFFNSIFKQRDIGLLPAIAHGRVNESHAAQLYVETMKADGRPVAIQECGLCLHQQYRFLGASPDRVVYDNSTVDCFGLLEIKCPYKAYTLRQTVIEACAEAQFCCALTDGRPHLKKTHAYYHQVQGQMAITGLRWCDFVVWVGHGDLHVERIYFDSEMWEGEMLPKLLTAYQQYILLEV